MDYSTLFNNTPIKILAIVLIASILHAFSATVLDHIVRRLIRQEAFETKLDEKKREDTIVSIFRTAAGVVIWLSAVGAIFSVLHFNVASVATGAGFFGIIVGLGAQTAIRDVVAGIFILIENQYRVGDIVTLQGGTTGLGTSGVVEEVSLRITKLRGIDGTLNIIRNGEAAVITNRTFRYSSVVLDIALDYNSDIDVVEKVMNEVGITLAADPEFSEFIDTPIAFLRVDDFTESAVMVKVLGKVKPAKQWDVAGAYRRRLLVAFKKHNITIASPRILVEKK
jgi:small-conductance mechanosensitive channel